jgi:YD repeat-containing protein
MALITGMTRQKPRCRSLIGWLHFLFILGFALNAQAQQPLIHYIYDDLGRLVGVVNQDGNAATYTYDAVGNILTIGRHNVADTPGPVAITLVAPNKGKIGTPVSIFGKGFSPDPTQNTVSFSGGLAQVTSATSNSIVTTVPQGALTGPITVTTPLGTAMSPEPFRVLGLVTLSPSAAVLVPNGTQQFTALEAGTATTEVTWAVDGIIGGDATVGTVSSTGLYTAPATVPSPPTATVTATLQDDATVSASAWVAILPPQPLLITAQGVSVGVAAPTVSSVSSLVAPAVSVSVGAPTFTSVNSLVSPTVSVSIAEPTFSSVNSLVAPSVSIQMAPPQAVE